MPDTNAYDRSGIMFDSRNIKDLPPIIKATIVIVGLAVLGTAIFLIVQTSPPSAGRLAKMVSTEAVVIEVESYASYRADQDRSVKISYTVNDTEYSKSVKLGMSMRNVDKGDHIAIKVDPDSPTYMIIDEPGAQNTYGNIKIAMILICVVVAAAFCVLNKDRIMDYFNM